MKWEVSESTLSAAIKDGIIITCRNQIEVNKDFLLKIMKEVYFPRKQEQKNVGL